MGGADVGIGEERNVEETTVETAEQKLQNEMAVLEGLSEDVLRFLCRQARKYGWARPRGAKAYRVDPRYGYGIRQWYPDPLREGNAAQPEGLVKLPKHVSFYQECRLRRWVKQLPMQTVREDACVALRHPTEFRTVSCIWGKKSRQIREELLPLLTSVRMMGSV